MKKTFSILTSIITILVILGAYFGKYSFSMEKEYLAVTESLKNTLNIILVSAFAAHILALVFGKLLSLCGKGCLTVFSVLFESVSILLPFAISGAVILLFGNSIYTVILAVSIPVFVQSLVKTGKIFLNVKEKRYYIHKYTLSKKLYYKRYTREFIIKPYFAAFLCTLRTATYETVILGALKVIDFNTVGTLFIGNDDMISGMAIISVAIFILLIQILCFLTKEKEVYENE